MRISDWSSDVCSSDLRRETDGDVPFSGRDHRMARARALPLRDRSRRAYRRDPLCRDDGKLWLGRGSRGGDDRRGDRTSVVSGKSVTVRVDTGGGRHLNKKKKSNTHTTTDIYLS